MVRHVVADRSEQQSLEPADSPRADDEEVGTFGRGDQRARRAVADDAAFDRRLQPLGVDSVDRRRKGLAAAPLVLVRLERRRRNQLGSTYGGIQAWTAVTLACRWRASSTDQASVLFDVSDPSTPTTMRLSLPGRMGSAGGSSSGSWWRTATGIAAWWRHWRVTTEHHLPQPADHVRRARADRRRPRPQQAARGAVVDGAAGKDFGAGPERRFQRWHQGLGRPPRRHTPDQSADPARCGAARGRSSTAPRSTCSRARPVRLRPSAARPSAPGDSSTPTTIDRTPVSRFRSSCAALRRRRPRSAASCPSSRAPT